MSSLVVEALQGLSQQFDFKDRECHVFLDNGSTLVSIVLHADGFCLPHSIALFARYSDIYCSQSNFVTILKLSAVTFDDFNRFHL